MEDYTKWRLSYKGLETTTLLALMLLLLLTTTTVTTTAVPAQTVRSAPQQGSSLGSIIVERSPTASEYWARTYGGTGRDFAYSVQQSSDGGYIVAGETSSFGAGGVDAWVLKLNPDGMVEWQKTYGGSGNDWAWSVEQTSDSGYIVAGGAESFGAGSSDLWLLKLNSTGSVAWQKAYGGYGGDKAFSVQQTTDGGYIVAGWTASFGSGDVWVLKLDSTGSVTWQKTYGGVSDLEAANSVEQTSDGGFIVSGYTVSTGTLYSNAWVLKLNPDGSLEWQKTCGGTGNDEANSVKQTSDGGYIMVGYTNSTGSGGYDFWVLKLNSVGSVAWQKTYGGMGDDWANSVQQTADGGYVVAGATSSFSGYWDVWVFKLDSSGSVEWQKTYGGTGGDEALSVEQTSDGGYIAAAWTDSFGAGGYDTWVLKLNSAGSVVWNEGSGASTLVTSVGPADFDAIVYPTPVTPADSAATVQNTQITPQETHATVTAQAGDVGGGVEAPIIVVSAMASVVVLLLLLALAYVRRRRVPTKVPAVRPEETANKEEITVVKEAPLRFPGSGRSRARAVSVVAPDSCPYCGVRLKVLDALFCWNCGASIERVAESVLIRRGGKKATKAGKCMICNLDVKEGQKAAWCPYCGNMAHETHLLEWLHVKHCCPICRAHLNESDLGKQS